MNSTCTFSYICKDIWKRVWDVVCYMANFLYLDHCFLTFSYPTVPQCFFTPSSVYWQKPRFCWGVHFKFYFIQKQKQKMKQNQKITKMLKIPLELCHPTFLPPVRLRITHGGTLQYYLLIIRLVNICTSHHFQIVNSSKEKTQSWQLVFFAIYFVLNVKLDRYQRLIQCSYKTDPRIHTIVSVHSIIVQSKRKNKIT